MRRGIKKIISSNNSNHIFPTAITINKETFSNLSDIANKFNNFFAKVAIEIQSSIRFSMKKYYEYFSSIFITPTDITEVNY